MPVWWATEWDTSGLWEWHPETPGSLLRLADDELPTGRIWATVPFGTRQGPLPDGWTVGVGLGALTPLTFVHRDWVKDGCRARHPLVAGVRAWQDHPAETAPFRPKQRASLSRLHKLGPRDGARLPAYISGSRTPEQPREALRASTVFLPGSLPDPSPTTSDSRAPGAISLHTGSLIFTVTC